VSRNVFPGLIVSLFVAACVQGGEINPGPEPCSGEWQQWVESRVMTGDGQGHGPDIGSDEWQSVVEFKLGIRGEPSVPPRDADEWCSYIDKQIRGN
jgi:hypothetical protein